MTLLVRHALKRNFLVINRQNENLRNEKLKISWLQLLCKIWLSFLLIYHRTIPIKRKSCF